MGRSLAQSAYNSPQTSRTHTTVKTSTTAAMCWPLTPTGNPRRGAAQSRRVRMVRPRVATWQWIATKAGHAANLSKASAANVHKYTQPLASHALLRPAQWSPVPRVRPVLGSFTPGLKPMSCPQDSIHSSPAPPLPSRPAAVRAAARPSSGETGTAEWFSLWPVPRSALLRLVTARYSTRSSVAVAREARFENIVAICRSGTGGGGVSV